MLRRALQGRSADRRDGAMLWLRTAKRWSGRAKPRQSKGKRRQGKSGHRSAEAVRGKALLRRGNGWNGDGKAMGRPARAMNSLARAGESTGKRGYGRAEQGSGMAWDSTARAKIGIATAEYWVAQLWRWKARRCLATAEHRNAQKSGGEAQIRGCGAGRRIGPHEHGAVRAAMAGRWYAGAMQSEAWLRHSDSMRRHGGDVRWLCAATTAWQGHW